MNRDESARRTARLYLDEELRSGRISDDDAVDPYVLRRLRSPSIPPRPIRCGQRLGMKGGRLDGIGALLGSALTVRSAALGADAPGPPRFLVRVDEFPEVGAFDQPLRYGMDAARRFHDVLASAGVPYLMAVVPQLTHAHLNPHVDGGRDLGPSEIAFLRQLEASRVTLAQHGTSHRTRFASPRRRSELSGLEDTALASLLDDGLDRLRTVGVLPSIFVPPFNRFDARQWATLSERYSVVTGGPESVPLVGLRPGPSWYGDAVYLPSYRPLYANAATVLDGVARTLDLAPGTWVPIVLHLGWEVDDGFRALSRLAARIAPYTEGWDRFEAAVDRSALAPARLAAEHRATAPVTRAA